MAAFLEFTDSGSEFVFGYLVSRQPFIAPLLNGTANEVAQQVTLVLSLVNGTANEIAQQVTIGLSLVN